MESRSPNAGELALWRTFERRVKAVQWYQSLIAARAAQIDWALWFGGQAGVSLPPISPDLVDRLARAQKQNDKWIILYNAVLAEQLRIQQRGDDLDLVASPTMSADQVAYFQTLGIAPIVWLIGGAIVITSIAAAIWATIVENKKLVSDFNLLLAETDKRYCSVPNSDLCRAWLARKNDQDYRAKETIAKKAQREITSIGSGIGSGLSTGLGIAIPIAALFFLSWVVKHDPFTDRI